MTIPVSPDWPEVFRNLERKTGLRPTAVCRVVKVNRAVGHRLYRNPDYEPSYAKAAAFLSLHEKLLPDVPIPERTKTKENA